MVKDPGAALHADAVKPVNTPEPVRVEEDAAGGPVVVRFGRRRQRVASIEDRWRIDDEWWRAEAVSRLYYNVALVSGQRLTLFKDLVSGKWYRQTY